MWAFECATISRPNATEATRCKTAANQHTTRKTMLRRRPENVRELSNTAWRSPGAEDEPPQDRLSHTQNAPNHAIRSRAIVTRKDAAIRLQSFGPPRPAHQRGAPLPTSARCARSPPPLLGFGQPGAHRHCEEGCRPRSAAHFLRHRVHRSRGVRAGAYTGRGTCAIAPGLVTTFRLWNAWRANRVYRAHSPYQ